MHLNLASKVPERLLLLSLPSLDRFSLRMRFYGHSNFSFMICSETTSHVQIIVKRGTASLHVYTQLVKSQAECKCKDAINSVWKIVISDCMGIFYFSY